MGKCLGHKLDGRKCLRQTSNNQTLMCWQHVEQEGGGKRTREVSHNVKLDKYGYEIDTEDDDYDHDSEQEYEPESEQESESEQEVEIVKPTSKRQRLVQQSETTYHVDDVVEIRMDKNKKAYAKIVKINKKNVDILWFYSYDDLIKLEDISENDLSRFGFEDTDYAISTHADQIALDTIIKVSTKRSSAEWDNENRLFNGEYLDAEMRQSTTPKPKGPPCPPIGNWPADLLAKTDVPSLYNSLQMQSSCQIPYEPYVFKLFLSGGSFQNSIYGKDYYQFVIAKLLEFGRQGSVGSTKRTQLIRNYFFDQTLKPKNVKVHFVELINPPKRAICQVCELCRDIQYFSPELNLRMGIDCMAKIYMLHLIAKASFLLFDGYIDCDQQSLRCRIGWKQLCNYKNQAHELIAEVNSKYNYE